MANKIHWITLKIMIIENDVILLLNKTKMKFIRWHHQSFFWCFSCCHFFENEKKSNNIFLLNFQILIVIIHSRWWWWYFRSNWISLNIKKRNDNKNVLDENNKRKEKKAFPMLLIFQGIFLQKKNRLNFSFFLSVRQCHQQQILSPNDNFIDC